MVSAIALPSNESALLLKEDLRALSEDITKLKDGVQTQISDRFDKSQSAMFLSLIHI